MTNTFSITFLCTLCTFSPENFFKEGDLAQPLPVLVLRACQSGPEVAWPYPLLIRGLSQSHEVDQLKMVKQDYVPSQ